MRAFDEERVPVVPAGANRAGRVVPSAEVRGPAGARTVAWLLHLQRAIGNARVEYLIESDDERRTIDVVTRDGGAPSNRSTRRQEAHGSQVGETGAVAQGRLDVSSASGLRDPAQQQTQREHDHGQVLRVQRQDEDGLNDHAGQSAGDLASPGAGAMDVLEDRRFYAEMAKEGMRARARVDGGLVYRGDGRHWNEVFRTGFRQGSLVSALEIDFDSFMAGLEGDKDFTSLRLLREMPLGDPRTQAKTRQVKERLVDRYSSFFAPRIVQMGEKVLGGISTTEHAPLAFRYGEGGFVYAIHLRSGGFDFTDVNDLQEINAVGIDPVDIIAAAGPIREVPNDMQGMGPGEFEAEYIRMNPKHTVAGAVAAEAINALVGGLFRPNRTRSDDAVG